MDIDLYRELADAGMVNRCTPCAGTGEVQIQASGVIIPVPCPGCGGPAWIDGYDSYPDLLNDMTEEDRCSSRTES